MTDRLKASDGTEFWLYDNRPTLRGYGGAPFSDGPPWYTRVRLSDRIVMQPVDMGAGHNG